MEVEPYDGQDFRLLSMRVQIQTDRDSKLHNNYPLPVSTRQTRQNLTAPPHFGTVPTSLPNEIETGEAGPTGRVRNASANLRSHPPSYPLPFSFSSPPPKNKNLGHIHISTFELQNQNNSNWRLLDFERVVRSGVGASVSSVEKNEQIYAG
ncbi:hypothetical protein M433DRAFT_494621 [Acidomyces richmondensis BFW]|nr:MAG: hypothetical protein FE78DRAFT_439529 [Acidomyces sp. 'richmondensis']KYG41179.1 hypothetical protein M433DRAFT_494621 [Acidomyces richmondensis BFW]